MLSFHLSPHKSIYLLAHIGRDLRLTSGQKYNAVEKKRSAREKIPQATSLPLSQPSITSFLTFCLYPL
jgi:hypothetical protein